MFLVEDFVPDRIEFDLSADKKGDRAGRNRHCYPSTAASCMARRPLPALEGELKLSTTRELGPFKGYFLASPTNNRPSLGDTVYRSAVVGEDGKATFRSPSTIAFDHQLVDAKVTVRSAKPALRRRALTSTSTFPARPHDRHPAGFPRGRGAARRHGQIT